MRPKSDHARLARVLAIAQADGWGLVAVSGPSGVVAAVLGDFVVAACAAIVTGAGVLELSARITLGRGDVRAVRRLWSAQLAALGAILVYAAHRWLGAEHAPWLARLPAVARRALDELLLSPDQLRALVAQAQRIVAVAVAATALLYQGGLAWWYARQTAAIRRALAAPETPASADVAR